MNKFNGVSVPLQPADLDAVEANFGFKFPEEFRYHYLEFNGGYPDHDQFVSPSGRRTVHDFLPVKVSKNSALSTLEQSVQRVKVERKLIPTFLVQFEL